jgi:hypothetical protein
MFWLVITFGFYERPSACPLWLFLAGVCVILTWIMIDYTADWIVNQQKTVNKDTERETWEERLETENWLGSKGYVRFDGSVEIDDDKQTIVFTSKSGKMTHTYKLPTNITGQRGKYVYWVNHPFMTIRFGNETNRFYEKR